MLCLCGLQRRSGREAQVYHVRVGQHGNTWEFVGSIPCHVQVRSQSAAAPDGKDGGHALDSQPLSLRTAQAFRLCRLSELPGRLFLGALAHQEEDSGISRFLHPLVRRARMNQQSPAPPPLLAMSILAQSRVTISGLSALLDSLPGMRSPPLVASFHSGRRGTCGAISISWTRLQARLAPSANDANHGSGQACNGGLNPPVLNGSRLPRPYVNSQLATATASESPAFAARLAPRAGGGSRRRTSLCTEITIAIKSYCYIVTSMPHPVGLHAWATLVMRQRRVCLSQ